MRQGDEVYMLKVAQSQGVGFGCYVNLKTILEPFSELSLGKSGYVSLVDQNGKKHRNTDGKRNCNGRFEA